MMIYFTGSTFNQVIKGSIKKEGELVFDKIIEDNQDFYKYIKQNITNLGELDCLILDVSVCTNTDEELLSSLEMLRTMYDRLKIVILAPYYGDGNAFLNKCFQMGILNIINTDDFRQIETELTHCIRTGMTYREASRFKEIKEKDAVKRNTKRTVNKRLIGVAGVESNIGTTHNAIVLANYLRKKGFMVALAEKNDTDAFAAVCHDYDEKMYAEGYFTINGVDFWPKVDEARMQAVQARPYNVIVIDFGVYAEENKDAFERCEDKLIILGAKSWEMESVHHVFEQASKDILQKYVFLFNFTPTKDYESIRNGMSELKNVYFLKHTEDPFQASDFPEGDTIFESILPEQPEEKKKEGVVGRLLEKMRKKVQRDENSSHCRKISGSL